MLGCVYKPPNVSTEIFTAKKSHNNGTVSMKDSNGNTINNPQTIVNKFNDFFTNIDPKLASKICPSNVNYKSCLCGSFVNSFFASPTTPEEIINIVSSLKKRNSEGTDCINIKVIKASIYLMAYPLYELCNTPFSTGIVLDSQNQQISSHI